MKKMKSIKTKLSITLTITIITGIILILAVLYFSLQNLASKTAHEEMEKIGQYYSAIFNDTVAYPSDYVQSIVSNTRYFIDSGKLDRVEFQQLIYKLFSEYPYVEASALILEADIFDGNDKNYIDSSYGTVFNGRLSYYHHKQDGAASYVIGTEKDEEEYVQPYYVKPVNERKMTLTGPYLYDIDDSSYIMITISAPIFDNTNMNIVGVVTADIFLDDLFEELKNEKIYTSGYMVITNDEGMVVYSPRNNDIGQQKDQVGLDYDLIKYNEITYSYTNSIVNGENSLVATLPIDFTYMDTPYYISIVVPLREINSDVNNLLVMAGGLLLLATIILICVTYISISGFLKPMKRLVFASQNISEGNFNIDLPLSTNDEVGFLANNFKHMMQTINNILSDIQELSEKHSDGQIGFMLDADKYDGTYVEVVKNINKMALSYASMIQEVMTATHQFANGDFTVTIKDYPGDIANLSNSINGLKANLLTVKEEINLLVSYGVEGKLSSRANAHRLNGDWNGLLNGLNGILDAVVTPVTEIKSVMEELEKGNLNVFVKGNYKGDFALLKDSINVTIQSISGYVDEIAEILDKLADGDLKFTIEREYVGQYKKIKHSILYISESLNKIIAEINTASTLMVEGAAQISNSSIQVAQGATEQATAIMDLNNSVEIISQQIKSTAERASNVNELSSMSSLNAKAGKNEMERMLQSMDSIKESSENISKINKVVEDIAFQTSLLALNAAIEASRVSAHGKGFAVVAEEVRNLAAKSQDAAKDTAQLIMDSVSKVSGGTENANVTANILFKIATETDEVSEIISAIAASAEEQAKAIEKVSNFLGHISDVVQLNQATSEETSAAAEELNAQAEMLKQLVSYFKLK